MGEWVDSEREVSSSHREFGDRDGPRRNEMGIMGSLLRKAQN